VPTLPEGSGEQAAGMPCAAGKTFTCSTVECVANVTGQNDGQDVAVRPR
jgi:hypothetical protein